PPFRQLRRQQDAIDAIDAHRRGNLAAFEAGNVREVDAAERPHHHQLAIAADGKKIAGHWEFLLWGGHEERFTTAAMRSAPTGPMASPPTATVILPHCPRCLCGDILSCLRRQRAGLPGSTWLCTCTVWPPSMFTMNFSLIAWYRTCASDCT